MLRKKPHPNVERCPCCHQIVPPRLIFENKPVRQRIYDYISAHPEGVTRDQVMDAVYGDDINGGAESRTIISVHLNRMNPTLMLHGLKIRSRLGGGPGATYKLVACEGAAE